MQVEYLPPPPPLPSPVKPITEYELNKFLNVQRNNEKLREMGLPTLAVDVRDAFKQNTGKKVMQDEDEYIPDDDQSEDEPSKHLPKVLHVIFTLLRLILQ